MQLECGLRAHGYETLNDVVVAGLDPDDLRDVAPWLPVREPPSHHTWETLCAVT
eukprot:SAG31_NODE_41948_length_273_cov_2.011494_1_plen_53_part_01